MFATRLSCLSSVRPLATGVLRRAAFPASGFHSSAARFVQVGDKIPNVELAEGSPGTKVNIASELKGKGLVIGVPAAFSPACSESHIPGYINSSKLKDAGNVFVVSVNDAFVYVPWSILFDLSIGASRHFAAVSTFPLFVSNIFLFSSRLPCSRR